jgi:hypothetical protein
VEVFVLPFLLVIERVVTLPQSAGISIASLAKVL